MMKKMMFLPMAMSALLLVGCGAQDQQAPQAESSTPASVVMTMEELKPYVDAEFEHAVTWSVLTTKVMKLIRDNAVIE